MNAGDLLLGIDGGGTKTVAGLASCFDDDSAIIARGESGPSNPRVVGHEAACRNLSQAVLNAFEHAGIEWERVRAACLGIAGAGRDEDRSRLEQWARDRNLAAASTVVHDGLITLYSAFPDGCGVVVISGTGSFAFGRDATGTTARSGGWGPVFGDEGSGYAIAVEALRAVAHAVDGRGPETHLSTSILRHVDVTDVSNLVTELCTSTPDRPRIAGLAPHVFEAAAQRDSVALRILDEAATDLAELILAVAQRLSLPSGSIPLAVTGGVLLHQRQFVETVVSRLRPGDSETGLPNTVRDPLTGAIRLARELV